MHHSFYSINEEYHFENSLEDFKYLLEDYVEKPPTLEEALMKLFQNAGLSQKDSKDIYNNLNKVCNHKVNNNWNLICEKNEGISKEDALILSSYTYEPENMYKDYSPYRLLNTSLVAKDRKKGVINVEKYLFLFLRALRGLKRCKKNCLYRCLPNKVKLEKDLKDNKYIPYEKGNVKKFWGFTSTSDDEETSKRFLDDNGKGTEFIIVGEHLWGYDLTLFNIFDEKEIILEPERLYKVKDITTKGDLTEITCEIITNPPRFLVICDTNIKCPKCESKSNTLIWFKFDEKIMDEVGIPWDEQNIRRCNKCHHFWSIYS